MSLLSLHTELILDVFDYLDDQDVLSARLSHRSLERASFAHFGRRFFRKKGFMITTPSLKVLQEVASHVELRRYVQHVWFNPDCFTFTDPDIGLHEAPIRDIQLGIPLRDGISDQRHRTLQECKDDHDHLIHTSQLEYLLSASFALLPNLHTVGMRRGEAYTPYGCNTLIQATGFDPRVLGMIPSGPVDDLSDATYLFVALIKAISKGANRLARLYTDAIELDNISSQLLPQDDVIKACKSLLYVEANAVRAWLTDAAVAKNVHLASREADYGRGLSRMVEAMPHLKELGLQVFPDRKQSHLLSPDPSNLDSWRSSYPFIALQQLARSVSLGNLTRVKLEKLTTEAPILQSLLAPGAVCLNSVKLRDVRLLTSRPETLPWRAIFMFLVADCPKLDYVLFDNLMYVGNELRDEADGGAVLPSRMTAELWEVTTASNSKFMQARGRELIQICLGEMRHRRYNRRQDFSVTEDDTAWHTDTSDEDW